MTKLRTNALTAVMDQPAEEIQAMIDRLLGTNPLLESDR